MEKGECKHFVYLDLECEIAHLFMLVSTLHEDRWEYGFDQCTGLRKDEELQTYEGWQFLQLGLQFAYSWEKMEKKTKYSKAWFYL